MTVGPHSFEFPFSDTGERMAGLGVSVSVSLPAPVSKFLKSVPDIRAEAKSYAKSAETQASRGIATADAAIVAGESIAVAAMFGLIIYGLLSRERK